MSQEELYKLAGELSTKDIVYLACAHLEHIKKMEYGGTIEGQDRTYYVNVECEMK